MSSIIFKGIDIKNRVRNIEVEETYRIDFKKLGLQSLDLSPLKEWEFSNRVRNEVTHQSREKSLIYIILLLQVLLDSLVSFY